MIGQIEKFGRRRIVRRSDGVAAHRLEQLDLAFGGTRVECCPDGAEIVVIANTVDLDPAAIQIETIGFPLGAADADAGFG